MKKYIDGIANTEFQPVAAAKLLALHALPIDEGAVPAGRVDQEKLAALTNNFRMFARDAGIGNDQIAIRLAPYSKRTAVENERSLGPLFDHENAGKYAGTGPLTRVAAGTDAEIRDLRRWHTAQ